jgi:hypothetical protein
MSGISMKRICRVAVLAGLLPCAVAAQIVSYDGNRVVLPADYREWVFLTSSLDLNYNDAVPGASGRPSVLDNVFVNPEAWRSFVQTGTWPDKTVFVKENRIAASAGTISKSGKFQTGIASLELHIKDEARFRGKWAFFVSNGKTPGVQVPMTADFYSCHAQHGAVDSTFVQFYPTLLEIAKTKGTLSAGYMTDERALAGAGK